MSSYREIDYEPRGDVGVITIDRPEARNALTFTTYAELTDAVITTGPRCLVITGRDPAFCSGDDVKQVMADAGTRVSSSLGAEPRLTPAAKALLETKVPVIAAVNGPAVGWGMELALMADIRVCSERAKFGELFVKRGLCCDVAECQIDARQVEPARVPDQRRPVDQVGILRERRPRSVVDDPPRGASPLEEVEGLTPLSANGVRGANSDTAKLSFALIPQRRAGQNGDHLNPPAELREQGTDVRLRPANVDLEPLCVYKLCAAFCA